MIHPGLCSLTLGHLPPAEVVGLCAKAGLTHIEWWGKRHVPPGDVDRAREVSDLTSDAGLAISTYGSYYRAGVSEGDGLSFDDVFRTALALGAPAIRVWAGTKGSETCTEQGRAAVVADTLRIAKLCAAEGVGLVFEYHAGTLTDTNASATAFADEVEHSSVSFGWQVRTGASVHENLAGLRAMLPRLATMHVFNWSKSPEGEYVRHPLGEGADEWRGYLEVASEAGRDLVALLEFVRGDTVVQLEEDARVLRGLLCG